MHFSNSSSFVKGPRAELWSVISFPVGNGLLHYLTPSRLCRLARLSGGALRSSEKSKEVFETFTYLLVTLWGSSTTFGFSQKMRLRTIHSTSNHPAYVSRNAAPTSTSQRAPKPWPRCHPCWVSGRHEVAKIDCSTSLSTTFSPLYHQL